MNRTQIEWVKNPDGSPGYTWNPITGCLNHDNGLCKGGGFPCYAYKLANTRLKKRYLANKQVAPYPQGYSDPVSAKLDLDICALDPFYPRFWEERLEVFKRRYKQLQTCTVYPKKLGIFPCDMGDLFGIGIPEEWTKLVLEVIRINAYDRFYLLTKQPQNLIKWSPFPENCWVGVTATNGDMFRNALFYLRKIEARVKYVSLEPLLAEIPMLHIPTLLEPINWLIIGQQTPVSAKTEPRAEWINQIVDAADKTGIPVFLKDNLKPLFSDALGGQYALDTGLLNWDGELRQEFPKVQ